MKTVATAVQFGEHASNLRVGLVLEEPDHAEPLAVLVERLARQVCVLWTEKRRQARLERRPDTPPEFVRRRDRPAEFTECVLNAPGDAGERGGQGTIQVEQQMHVRYRLPVEATPAARTASSGHSCRAQPLE